jgi:hypothetical protein
MSLPCAQSILRAVLKAAVDCLLRMVRSTLSVCPRSHPESSTDDLWPSSSSILRSRLAQARTYSEDARTPLRVELLGLRILSGLGQVLKEEEAQRLESFKGTEWYPTAGEMEEVIRACFGTDGGNWHNIDEATAVGLQRLARDVFRKRDKTCSLWADVVEGALLAQVREEKTRTALFVQLAEATAELKKAEAAAAEATAERVEEEKRLRMLGWGWPI